MHNVDVFTDDLLLLLYDKQKIKPLRTSIRQMFYSQNMYKIRYSKVNTLRQNEISLLVRTDLSLTQKIFVWY